MRKVMYKHCDNSIYEYFIVAEKKEIEIDKNSLVFKLDNKLHKIDIIDQNGITGNHDYILKEINIKSREESFIACQIEDIKF